MNPLLLLALLQVAAPGRTIAIDARFAADAGLRVGSRVVVAATAGGAGDTVVVSAILARRADPSQIARNQYRVWMHLDQLESVIHYGNRVDRFAIATRDSASIGVALRAINNAAFGFRAWPSREIAAESSETFRVVSRFHRAIGVITIVASAIFLLCILLMKVEERRRDVAALRLIGISRWSILRSVVLEAAVVALAGSALGVLIGWAASWLVNAYYQAFYDTPLRFSIITGHIVVFAVTLSLALGIVAGTLAALRLVQTPPLALLGR